MDKKILTVFLSFILVIIVLGGAAFYFLKQPGDELPIERAGRVNISEFSFGGEVVAIRESDITLQSGWVERTEAGNRFVEHAIIVKLDSGTKMFLVAGEEKQLMLVENPITYLRNKDKLTVYSQESPYNGGTITASRVEIFR